jgi:hypothetical protein
VRFVAEAAASDGDVAVASVDALETDGLDDGAACDADTNGVAEVPPAVCPQAVRQRDTNKTSARTHVNFFIYFLQIFELRIFDALTIENAQQQRHLTILDHCKHIVIKCTFSFRTAHAVFEEA